jgi:exo-1,4-beta-D-glucosaminidase
MHYVVFKISRPHNQWGGKAYENDTDLAISFVDWNPEAPDSNMGIWQPVDIEIFNNQQLTVSSAYINTKIIDEQLINLDIILYIKNWETKTINTALSLQLGDFIELNNINIVLGALEEKQIILSSEKYSKLSIKYDKEKLWWPYQMGNQNTHNLTIKFNNYYYTKELAFRQIESEYDSVKEITVYKINKKKLLLKGAGWTPDLFLRQSPDNYYNHIKYVKDMGLNVIRLEGKSEGEEFYEYCDKMGILLISGWNCADAWQRWGRWDETVNKISDISVKSQIRKLSPHPSVIIFILGSDYHPNDDIEKRWRKIFLEEKWPNEILSSAARYALEGYPTGVKMSGPYSWVPPNYFFLKNSRNNKYGGAYGF